MQPNEANNQATSNTTVDPSATKERASNSAKTTKQTDYISNPFLNTVRGLVAILQSNPVPVMLSGLVFLLAWFAFYMLLGILGSTLPVAITMLLMLIAVPLGWLVIYGAYIEIAARSAAGEVITTSQAFQKGFQKIIPLLVFMILYGLGMMLGFVLFIVPGVIFAARFSLSPLIMFEENMSVIAAMKRSAKLTKGHVNEMLGALFAGAFMGSQGLLIGAIGLAPLVGRYHDLKLLDESGAPKPKVHWLNYTYLIGVVLVVLLAILMGVSASQLDKAKNDTNFDYKTNGSYRYDFDSNTSPSFDYDYSN